MGVSIHTTRVLVHDISASIHNWIFMHPKFEEFLVYVANSVCMTFILTVWNVLRHPKWLNFLGMRSITTIFLSSLNRQELICLCISVWQWRNQIFVDDWLIVRQGAPAFWRGLTNSTQLLIDWVHAMLITLIGPKLLHNHWTKPQHVCTNFPSWFQIWAQYLPI